MTGPRAGAGVGGGRGGSLGGGRGSLGGRGCGLSGGGAATEDLGDHLVTDALERGLEGLSVGGLPVCAGGTGDGGSALEGDVEDVVFIVANVAAEAFLGEACLGETD